LNNHGCFVDAVFLSRFNLGIALIKYKMPVGWNQKDPAIR